jgi:anhydro-N-acetylmuramic acid kinase
MADAARGRPVWALGLMSGTSMDGIDAAQILTDGEEVAHFGEAGDALSAPYDEAARAAIASALGWGPAAEAEALVDARHAEVCERVLRRRTALIGYHGQTVAHDPEGGRTRQLGDGARLARATGLPVVWDFRSADMAAGGEGAPLAPFYHFAMARHLGAREPVAFLNVGGVANITWADPRAAAPEAPGALIAFDTGPGNALIDDFVRARAGVALDMEGRLAGAGTVQARYLASNAAAAFLARRPPKSLDRDAFQAVRAAVAPLSTEDGAATLTAFTADCVAAALPHLPVPPARWLVCGGGRHNATLMRMLAERLGAPVEPVEAAGLDGDMLEAQAFAFLAVRVLRGLATSAPGTTGCRAAVSGGRIARP